MRKFFRQFFPMLLVLCFILPVGSTWAAVDSLKCWENVGLGWELNVEADMDLYTVYYGVVVPTDETLSDFVDPLIVPHATATREIDPDNPDAQLIMTVFPKLGATGIYYFGVTASDKSGNESPLSNTVSCLSQANSENIPRIFFRTLRE